MKITAFLFFLFPVLMQAQSGYNYRGFSHIIDVSKMTGKKFRLQAAVKVQAIDSAADSELFARIDKNDRKFGFNYDLKSIRNNHWTVYTINGKIDDDARILTFGGRYTRKGIFYFDNFRLWIEGNNGELEEIAVTNGSFEADSLRSNWYFAWGHLGYVITKTTDTAFNGKYALKIDGTAFKATLTFGNNDSTGKYATVNGIKIYYETYGAGEPLLLLHGNSSSINSFRLQIPEFAKHYRVIAVDTRGQGKSGNDGKPYTYDLFADDMAALLDHLQIDSARVLGWSDGGNTGLIMAMKYPAKVKRMVTMGANVFIDNTVVDNIVFKELKKQLKELRNDTTAWGMNRVKLLNMLLTEPRHSFDELKAIKCPVLVLAGEKDIIKPGHTKQIAAHISKSTLLIAPKETHEYPWENARAFNSEVLNYLMW